MSFRYKIGAIALLIVALLSSFYLGRALLGQTVNSACSRLSGPHVLTPDGAYYVDLKTEICTGLARRSDYEIDVGKNDKTIGTVFAQDGPVPPTFNWHGDHSLEIDVESSGRVFKSLHGLGPIDIQYFIPEGLSKQAFINEEDKYKERMKLLIEHGRIDFSGGDVEGNLKNLNEYVQRDLEQYGDFFKWLSSNNVHIKQKDGG